MYRLGGMHLLDVLAMPAVSCMVLLFDLTCAASSNGLVSTREQLSELVFCSAIFTETLRVNSSSTVLFFHNAVSAFFFRCISMLIFETFTCRLRKPFRRISGRIADSYRSRPCSLAHIVVAGKAWLGNCSGRIGGAWLVGMSLLLC